MRAYEKLGQTIFSGFKKVAINEFDRFLKISTVEKQKILKKWRNKVLNILTKGNDWLND